MIMITQAYMRLQDPLRGDFPWILRGLHVEYTQKTGIRPSKPLGSGPVQRRNAYIDDNVEVVLKSVREYGVDVKAVLRR